MNSLAKAKDILVSPKHAWETIEQNNEGIGDIYKSYLMVIGLVPSIAGFVGMSLIGYGGFGMSFRVPIAAGLASMVTSYVMLLVMCFVVALIVDALAPTFGGQKSRVNAFKVVAYGSTAGIVGGVFNAVPSLAVLGVIAALYSIYLFYLGLPTLMKCPQEKAVGYTAVVVICAIVAGVVIGSVSALFGNVGSGPLGSGSSTPDAASIQLNTPQGTATIEMSGQDGAGSVKITTPEGQVSWDAQQLEEWGKRVEALNEKLDKANESGNNAEAARLTGNPPGQ